MQRAMRALHCAAQHVVRPQQTMRNWSPDVLIEVELFSTHEGGRLGATPPDTYGVILGINGEHWSVRLDLTDSGSITPGGKVIASAKFLSPDAHMRFPVGAAFSVWEIGDIGKGRVLANYHAV